MPHNAQKMFIFGLGFSGQKVAQTIDFDVIGTTRSAHKASQLQKQGLKAYVFEGVMSDELKSHMQHTTHLLISAGPNAQGDPILNAVPTLAEMMPKLEWVGYLSTIGVYGNFEGGWISEHTPPQPVSQRGQWRLKAEAAWAAFAAQKQVPLAIIRLAGIYGTGRSSFEKLKNGTARRIVKKGQVFNRIHVDDIAQIVCAAASQKACGIFNGADDEPAAPQTVVEYAAKIAHMDVPPLEPFESAQMSAMARSFYGDNKRCGNARLKKDLGLRLKYPTYKEGLKAIFEQSDQ